MQFFSRHSGRIDTRWTYDAKSQIVSSPIVADLEKSGNPHVIIGTKDGRVLSLSPEGKEEWAFATKTKLSEVESYFVDTERANSIDASPVIADVDMDGKQEILFGTEIGTLYCIDSGGKLRWKHECGGGIRARCCVADINMDGKPEILVGSQNGKLTVLTGNGDVLFEYTTGVPIESTPGVLKSTRSRSTLIIFGDSKGAITAITPAQELVWRKDLGAKITAQPTFFASAEEERFVIGTTGGMLYCISEHGEIVWKYSASGSIDNAATVVDLDSDGRPEILFSSCDNTIYALTNDGRKAWSYETDFWISGSPLVADIDGDGTPEVIVGSYDHSVYVLDSEGQYVMDYVPGIAGIVSQAGHYGSIMTSDPGAQAGKKLFQYKLDSMVLGCDILHGKEKSEIVVSTKSGQIILLRHER